MTKEEKEEYFYAHWEYFIKWQLRDGQESDCFAGGAGVAEVDRE